MADALPAKLRQADITRFMNRANQLRQYKPAIAYWCHYWVVNQILAKQLHNADDECLTYTTNLMDELEQTKTQHPNDEAIMDDSVGQAVVEQFAQQTFERAERTMTASKVTRQTADTFDAAATFFQLLNVWGQPDIEVQQKIKYAKWNAARILKAIKAGEDPNDSNPQREEPSPSEVMPTLDADDPDVQQVAGSSAAHPATVEDDPDTEFYRQQEVSAPTSSIAAAPQGASTPDANQPQDSNPYFPPTQHFPPSPLSGTAPEIGGTGAGELPSAPSPDLSTPNIPSPPIQAPGQQSPANPSAVSPPAVQSPETQQPPPDPPVQPQPRTPAAAPAAVAPQPPVQRAPVPAAAPAPTAGESDDADLTDASKHARFAISALNFEDVPTAVKELRAALAALGAQ